MFNPSPKSDGDVYYAGDVNTLYTLAAGASWLQGHFARNRFLDCHSVNGTSVVIHPYLGAVIQGEFYDQNAYSGATVTVADKVGGGSFANNTWYYVYAQTLDPSPAVAGPTYVISPTAPDAALSGQSDGFGSYLTAYPYVCAFRTNGSAAIEPFQKTGNTTRYYASYSIFSATPGGGGAVAAAVSLTEHFPPHAKKLLVSAVVGVGTSTDASVNSTATGGGFLLRCFKISGDVGQTGECTLPFKTTASAGATTDFVYNLDAGGTFSVSCLGFVE